MKRTLFLLILSLVYFCDIAYCQDTSLLDENYMKVKQIEHAHYKKVYIPNKSSLHKTEKIFDLNNNLVSWNDTTFSAVDSSYTFFTKEWWDSSKILYENCSGSFKDSTIKVSIIRYFKNGKTQFKYQTINKLLNGNVISYWPNGKLKRNEVYKKDVLVSGSVWDKKGKKIKHYPFMTSPDFKMDLHRYFAMNVRYTPDATQKQVEGKIIVRFAIDTNGNVSDIKILKPLFPSLDKEVIRVVKLLPNVTPGTLDGEKIKSFYRMPLTFNLSD